MLRFIKKKRKKNGKDDADDPPFEYVQDIPTEITSVWPVPAKPGFSKSGKAWPLKLNESVWELYKPEGRPKLDVVFFHGLQLPGYKLAYVETWQSGDECWPQLWLPEHFPGARILSVSYDASARKSKVEGRIDLHKLGEILVEDVICDVEVGHDYPVILVGHSLGGIVIKQLCLQAERSLHSRHIHHYKNVKKFLKHVRGIFYYSTPHGGSQVANVVRSYLPSPGAMLDYLTVLSTHTGEINEAFAKLRKNRGWRADGVGESKVTKIGPFWAVIVTESSAQVDVDHFSLLDDDHLSICKPSDPSAPSYLALKNFIMELIPS